MLMVTGIRADIKQQEQYQSHLNETFGVAAKLVINNTSGTALDISFAIAGMLSSSLGFQAESDTSCHLYRQIIKGLQADGEVKLLVYSQGSIITCNTLVKIKERLIENGKEAEWASLADRISITAIGAAMHIWPKEITKIRSLALEGDIVSKITLPALRLYQKFIGDQYRLVSPQIQKFDGPKAEAHSFFNYVKLLQEQFVLEQ